MTGKHTHLSAPMQRAEAEALFRNRRTDLLNAWRQLAPHMTLRAALSVAAETSRVMRDIVRDQRS